MRNARDILLTIHKFVRVISLEQMETCGKTVLLQISICSFKMAAEPAALSWRQRLCMRVRVCSPHNALHLTSKIHREGQVGLWFGGIHNEF